MSHSAPLLHLLLLVVLVVLPSSTYGFGNTSKLPSILSRRCRDNPLCRNNKKYPCQYKKQQVDQQHRIKQSGGIVNKLILPHRSSSTSQLLSLIHPDDIWGNWSVLSGMVVAAQYLSVKTSIGKLLGPPVTAMALTFVMSSIGVLNPGGTVAAQTLQLFALQIATPLVLLGGADLRNAISSCGPLLVSFVLASISSIVACWIGWQCIGPNLLTALSSTGGNDGLIIAAALLAKNVGGGINYIAVCRVLNASTTAIAAGLCIDNIFALIYFPITSILAKKLKDVATPATISDSDSENTSSTDIGSNTSRSISVESLSGTIFLAAALLWLGEKIAVGLLPAGTKGAALPICTLLSVFMASIVPRDRPWVKQIQMTADKLGLVALYLFFATAGAPGLLVAESVKASIVPLFAYLFCLYSVHGGILFTFYKLFGKHQPKRRSTTASFVASFCQPQRLLVASSAAIGGPATSLALCSSSGWETLKLPSLIVGNVGYTIATFVGLLFYRVFS